GGGTRRGGRRDALEEIGVHAIGRRQHECAHEPGRLLVDRAQRHSTSPGRSFTNVSIFSDTPRFCPFCWGAAFRLSIIKNRSDLSTRLMNFARFGYVPVHVAFMVIMCSVSLPSIGSKPKVVDRTMIPESLAICTSSP